MSAKAAIVAGLFLAMLMGGAAYADDHDHDEDQDQARRAVQTHAVMPIAQILPLVSRYFAGDIIEVKLDTKRENVYYEIKVLDSAGRVRELVLDARTGGLVKAGN